MADNELRDVNDQVVDSVTATNLKVVAELPAISVGQMVQSANAHLNRINVLAENGITLAQTALSSAVKSLLETDPVQASAIKQMQSGDVVAEKLAALQAAIASGQQQAKTAQTTPPETGGGGPDLAATLGALVGAVESMQQTLATLVAK